MAMASVLTGFAVIILTWWLYRLVAPRLLYPRVLSGLPHNHQNARRFLGDMADVGAFAAKTGCTQSEAVFEVVVHRGPAQSPIVQLLTPRFMSQAAIVLVDEPREVEDILRRRGKEFDRSAMTAAFFEPLLPRASIAKFTTSELKAQKKLWAEAVSPDFVRKAAVPLARQSALRLVDIWQIKAVGKKEGHNNHIFDAIPDFLDANMDLMWALVLGSDLGVLNRKLWLLKDGKDLDDDDDDDDYASGWTTDHNDLGLSTAAESSRNMFFQVTSFLEHESSHIRSGWAAWRLKWIKFTPRYHRVRREMETEMRKLVADARSKFHPNITRDGQVDDGDVSASCAMHSVLRREALAAQKEGVVNYTTNNIEQELMLFMIAGIDSTAYTLAWCVKFLSRHTDIQDELRRYLRSAYVGASLPSADEIVIKTLPYLDAFLHEILRFAVTAGSVNRRVTVDTQILGYRVAAGTELVINTRVLRRPIPCHESLRSASSRQAQEKRVRGGIDGASGDELDKFSPRRWLYRQEDGTEAFDAEALPTLVFSHGVRGCFGKRLAMHNLRVFVVILVLSFEFLLPTSSDADDWSAEEAIFRSPKHAVVKLRPLQQ